MNWEAIGATGEVIGAIAVFATLAYLAVQIKQSTKSTQSVAELETTKYMASLTRRIGTDPQMRRIWDDVADGKDLEDHDRSPCSRLITRACNGRLKSGAAEAGVMRPIGYRCMIRSFKHKGLERYFLKGSSSGIQAVREKRLRLILGRPHTAEVKDSDLPGLYLHQIKGKSQGRWSVRVGCMLTRTACTSFRSVQVAH